MSKELEALKKIVSYQWWNCYNDEAQEMSEKEQEAYDCLVKYLTPPTQEEVCKAFSEYYREPVLYINEKPNRNGFYFEKSTIFIVRLENFNVRFADGMFFKLTSLPPHLLTLIGRFYEGLEAELND